MPTRRSWRRCRRRARPPPSERTAIVQDEAVTIGTDDEQEAVHQARARTAGRRQRWRTGPAPAPPRARRKGDPST